MDIMKNKQHDIEVVRFLPATDKDDAKLTIKVSKTLDLGLHKDQLLYWQMLGVDAA